MTAPVVALLPPADADTPDPFGAVAAARGITGPHGTVRAILLGRDGGAAEAEAEAALREGADAVLLATHPALADPACAGQLVAAFAEAVAEAVADEATAAVHLLPAGPIGEEVAARLAPRIGAAPLGRCVALERVAGGRTHARRAAYGGRAEITLATDAPRCVAAMRRPPAPPAPRAATAPPAVVERRRLAAPLPAPAAPRRLGEAGGGGVRLEAARLIVAGGRGMGGEDGFALLRDLADALGGGAAVAGSLPAVDAGWVPVGQQVGQSGRYVTPALYLAIGISGTAQHLAGIGPETRILAINRDAEAEIFRVAELGVAAAWQDILPGLIAALRDG